MATLKEEKKREITDFMEDREEGDEVFPFEFEEMAEEFVDDTFNKEDVKEIIQELENDGVLKKDKLRMEVIYLTKYEEDVTERLGHLFVSSSIFSIFLVGSVMYLFFLLNVEPFFNFVIGDSNISNPQSLTFPTLSAIVGSYLFGKGSIEAYSRAQKNIEILRDYQALIVPTVGIWLIGLLGVWLYTSQTTQVVKPIVIATIFSAGIVGGVTFWHRVTSDTE